jgi:hypothetical protein
MRSIVRWFGAAFCLLAIPAATAWAADPALPYGINVHLPSRALLDRVAAAGIAWIRVDFNWFMMEPARGVYDWALTDAVVGEARARGLNIYATLAYAPAWANGGQAPNTPPVDPLDWYTFVYTTVSRYRGSVQHWGMWNEPNVKHFFSGSPAQYINTILEVGAQAVRDADPNGSVLGPELAQEGDWWQWLDAVLDRAAAAIDIVTQHSYQATGQDVLRRLGGPVEPWHRPTVRDVMQWTGTADKALWLTETGWNTARVSAEAQAASYEQVLAGVEGSDWLEKVFFYQLVDEPDTPDQWGILRVDLSAKPAYETYQRFIAVHPATPPTGWSDLVAVPGWFGYETQGADIAMADLDGNGRPELVIFHIDDAAGANAGHYRVGWDADSTGNVRQWSDVIPVSGWFGDSTQGAGIAIADLDGNGRPELVIFHIDDAAGANAGHYRVGWDLNTTGLVRAWSDVIDVPGWFGDVCGEAGTAVADLDGNGRPELVIFHIDDAAGANAGHYRVGWDLGANGLVRAWSDLVAVPGWFGDSTQGAGIAIADLDGNGQLDLMLFHTYDAAGANAGHYRVGWDLGANGLVRAWHDIVHLPIGFGYETQGAGIAVADVDRNGRVDLVVFHIDHPENNRGYYRIGWDLGREEPEEQSTTSAVVRERSLAPTE